MKRRLKINGVLIFVVVVLLILFPRIFFRNSTSELSDAVIESCGLALIIFGQLIFEPEEEIS